MYVKIYTMEFFYAIYPHGFNRILFIPKNQNVRAGLIIQMHYKNVTP